MQNSKSKIKDHNINVHVRIRPLNKSEITSGYESVIEALSDHEVHVTTHSKTYTFDKVYKEFTDQKTVYKNSVENLIDDVINGFNMTVFAYGQTGTGKTYTMGSGSYGILHNNNNVGYDSNMGIIPRSISQFFSILNGFEKWVVKISFLELYNEILFDLLSENKREIRIMESEGKNVLFPNAAYSVKDIDELFRLYDLGASRRAVSATVLNQYSSRSHAIFILTVQVWKCSEGQQPIVSTGKMNFVDLAGSENINRSGSAKQRACEAGRINQSLLAIGRVINALVEKSPHVPYRESKLTRILQDSLGGNTKTTLIATVSPAVLNIEETLNTLDYAHRAKKIKNHLQQTQKLEKKLIVDTLNGEIDKLKRDIEAQRSKCGIHLSISTYNGLMANHNSLKQEIVERDKLTLHLEEKLNYLTEEKVEVEMKLRDAKERFQEKVRQFAKLEKEYYGYKVEAFKNKLILTHYQHRFSNLQKETEIIYRVADTTASNKCVLHDKMGKLYAIAKDNFDRFNSTAEEINLETSKIEKTLKTSECLSNNFFDNLIDELGGNQSYFENNSTSNCISLSNIQGTLENLVKSLNNTVDSCDVNISELGENASRSHNNWLEKLKIHEVNSTLESFSSGVQNLLKNIEHFTEKITCRHNKLKDNIKYINDLNVKRFAGFKEDMAMVVEELEFDLKSKLNAMKGESKCRDHFCKNLIYSCKPLMSTVNNIRDGIGIVKKKRIPIDAERNKVQEKVNDTLRKWENCLNDDLTKNVELCENLLSKLDDKVLHNVKLKDDGNLSKQNLNKKGRQNLNRPNLRKPNLNRQNFSTPESSQQNLSLPNFNQQNLNQQNLNQQNLNQPNLNQPNLNQPNLIQRNSTPFNFNKMHLNHLISNISDLNVFHRSEDTEVLVESLLKNSLNCPPPFDNYKLILKEVTVNEQNCRSEALRLLTLTVDGTEETISNIVKDSSKFESEYTNRNDELKLALNLDISDCLSQVKNFRYFSSEILKENLVFRYVVPIHEGNTPRYHNYQYPAKLSKVCTRKEAVLDCFENILKGVDVEVVDKIYKENLNKFDELDVSVGEENKENVS